MEVAQHEAPEAHLFSYFQLFALYVFPLRTSTTPMVSVQGEGDLWTLLRVPRQGPSTPGTSARRGPDLGQRPWKPDPDGAIQALSALIRHDGFTGQPRRVELGEPSEGGDAEKRPWFNQQNWNWKRNWRRRGALGPNWRTPNNSSHHRRKGDLKEKRKLRTTLSSTAGWAAQAHSWENWFEALSGYQKGREVKGGHASTKCGRETAETQPGVQAKQTAKEDIKIQAEEGHGHRE